MLLLGTCMQVVPGQATEIFKRHIMPQFERLSFSLVYTEDKDNESRTLDLTCKNEQEFMLWFWGIQVSSCVSIVAGTHVIVTVTSRFNSCWARCQAGKSRLFSLSGSQDRYGFR